MEVGKTKTGVPCVTSVPWQLPWFPFRWENSSDSCHKCRNCPIMTRATVISMAASSTMSHNNGRKAYFCYHYEGRNPNMTMKFGLLVPQGWRMDLVGIADPIEAYETMTRVAQEAEAVGFDSFWLFDHFHTVPTPTQEVTFECWTSTAALARDTRRVRIGQMVTCNGYRNPALLAKMASTVDVLSHGRLNFGIGAGWFEHEYRAYGYDYPDTSDRLRHLREAVQVILAMWTQEEAVFEGKYYQVRGAINQPKGIQKPHIPLLIGGGGEQVTLKLVAQYADACNI